ncbi:MAG TPA: GNAT family N-acetyltransferase [Acidimicrobiales bacterium]|nr:GNAT family N-acetyltransferase [Acidimicrobiales bacterium]
MGGASAGKVVAFITRPAPTGAELLVFYHPNAGVQVPAGTLEAAENPLDGARREAWEETGLDGLRLVTPLGQCTEGPAGERVRYFFHFVSEVETAGDWWVVTPDGGGLCWHCRWAPLSDVRLIAGQQEWLDPVRTRLATMSARQPAPRPRVAIDPLHRNATTFELFWAPPFGGRRTLCSWLSPEEISSEDVIERALAVCFTVDGRIVLVSGDGKTLWNHPGGGREMGESIDQTMRREVYEEACAHVLASTLAGYDRFVDIDGAGTVLRTNHQARFAARVALEPFVARHETAGRTVVDFDAVPGLLPTWQPESLRRLLDLAGEASAAPDWIVELATARRGLSLRELTAADADGYFALIDRNRLHLTRHGDYSGMATISAAQVQASLVAPGDDNTRFGIWLDGRLVGRVDLNPYNPPNYVLGVWLDEAATGKGHATEACRAAIAFARSHLRAGNIWAGVTHGNHRSVALLGRLGFERVAELDRHSRFRLRPPAAS